MRHWPPIIAQALLAVTPANAGLWAHVPLQTGLQRAQESVQLVIEAEKDSYHVGEAINLTARLKNLSSQTISPSEQWSGPWRTYTLVVSSESGERIKFEDKKKKKLEADGNHLVFYNGSVPLVIVQPGGEYKESLQGLEGFYSLLPGVTYSITASRELAGADDMRPSRVVSNTIKIRIED